jgi:hypothetical protein
MGGQGGGKAMNSILSLLSLNMAEKEGNSVSR